MKKENNEQPNLNVSDIDIVVQAIRVAYDRNAFKIEEAAQISASLQRLEIWLDYCREIQLEVEKMNNEQKENSDEIKVSENDLKLEE